MSVVAAGTAAASGTAANAGIGASIAAGAKAVGSWLSANSGALITGGASLLGSLFGSRSSGHMKDFWGAAKYADWANARADARSLANSKDLFFHQNVAGPSQIMQGYRQAGVNPILTGDFNANMPSFTAANQQAQYPIQERKVDYGAAIANAINSFLGFKELQSRINLQEANAHAVEERATSESELRDYRKSLLAWQAINESNIPAEQKERLLRSASERFLNEIKAENYKSSTNVNAKKLDEIKAKIDYYKEMVRRDSRFGYNSSYINFNFGDLMNWLTNPFNPINEVGRRIGKTMIGVTPEHD